MFPNCSDLVELGLELADIGVLKAPNRPGSSREMRRPLFVLVWVQVVGFENIRRDVFFDAEGSPSTSHIETIGSSFSQELWLTTA